MKSLSHPANATAADADAVTFDFDPFISGLFVLKRRRSRTMTTSSSLTTDRLSSACDALLDEFPSRSLRPQLPILANLI